MVRWIRTDLQRLTGYYRLSPELGPTRASGPLAYSKPFIPLHSVALHKNGNIPISEPILELDTQASGPLVGGASKGATGPMLNSLC